MRKQIVVVCKCPTCRCTYRQTVTGQWIGASWKVRRYETALRALCVEAGQGTDLSAWAGYAYCAACSLRSCPPSLQPALRAWLEKGEVK